MKTFIDHDIPSLTRIDSDTGRLYETPSGKKYPSVTSITGLLSVDSIQQWRRAIGESEANKISARASKRGSAIHSLCESYLKGEMINVSPFDQEMFSNLKPQLDRIDNIHCLETPLYSHHLEVAGTVDCIAEYDGKLCIIDFKTASKPKSRDMIHGYFMQCSAYAVAFEELTGISVPRLCIIMGVDDHHALTFLEKRNDWISQFKDLRKQYKQIKGI